RHQLGKDRPEGAIVYASFPAAPAEKVTLAVMDAGGKVVRTLVDTSAPDSPASPAVHAGLNRYNWDLSVEPRAPGTSKPAQRGPKAVPGTYRLRLTVGASTQSVTLRLVGDPRAHLTQQDYQSQFDLLMHIQDAMTQIQRAGTTIQSRRASLPAGDPELAQLDALQTALGATGSGRGAGRGGVGGRGAATGGVPPLMGEFSSLYTFVIGSEDRPTGGALDRYRDLRKALDQELAKLQAR